MSVCVTKGLLLRFLTFVEGRCGEVVMESGSIVIDGRGVV